MPNETNNDMNQTEFNRLMLEKMNRVETALCGDEAAGITGIVKKVVRHEKKLAWMERMVWSIGGAVTLLTILWAVFSEFHK